jgi:hypothetical protein
MGSNSIWEGIIHVAFGLMLLGSVALFAGATITPSPAAGLPTDVALAPDATSATCDAR